MRIAITGPESSGKTTLATELAKKINGTNIPEFVREYLIQRSGKYTQKDLDIIAQGQIDAWNTANSDTIIADTDLLVIYIWSKYKFNEVSEFIQNALQNQITEKFFDYYLLCSPDIPWEYDELRENENDRKELMQLYIEELTKRKIPFEIIEGNKEERLSIALQTINKK